MGYYYMAWAFGLLASPLITAFIHGYLGYTGTFIFFTGLIAFIGFTSIYFIPGRINDSKKDDDDEETDVTVSYT